MALPPPARSGFTLLELLAVIAIIAVLTALVFAGLQRALQNAGSAKSSSNLRQIALALNLYANENDGYYPPAWDAGAAEPYAAKLQPYAPADLTLRKNLYASPVARPLTASDGLPYNITYGLHGGLGLGVEDPLRIKSLQVSHPSRVILVADTVQLPGNFQRASSTIYAPNELYWPECPYPIDQKIPVFENDGNIAYPDSDKAHCAFVDGHVQVIRRGEVTWGNLLLNR
jgi:prepilin-type N-terminal cleavage/methylation domain-containing protein/prepilin-type processing-associated H-X9-DG protein